MQDPFKLIVSSFKQFTSHWKLFVGIFAVPGVLGALLSISFTYLDQINYENSTLVVASIVGSLIIAAAGILMSIAMVFAAQDHQISVGDAYRRAKGLFWSYLLLSILVGFAVAGGFLLLIIPGIIFLVWFAFSQYALVLERTKGIEAMKRSKALVSGRWWAVLGRVLIPVLVAIPISLIPELVYVTGDGWTQSIIAEILYFATSAVLTSVTVIYFYQVFMDLVRTSTSVPAPVSDPGQVSTNTNQQANFPREAM